MIIVRLLGGLGNQMFQYATAKNLSLLNNTELKIDLSGFDKKIYKSESAYRIFQLSIFKLNAEIATEEEINAVKNSELPFFEKLKYRLLRQNIPSYRKPELYEKQLFNFDSDVLKATANAYLTGYWQSYKFFESIRSALLNDFEFSETPAKIQYEFIDKIHQQNSVSVHIRRGDYVSNPEYTKIHGVCSTDYYHRAIEYICSKVENPAFYFFSDDMDWVKKNITVNNDCVYVTGTPAGKDFYEMYLMSICKHNIIANSSFSWWGAWLNKNTEKIVIAPKLWMADPTIDTTDLIPANWIRI